MKLASLSNRQKRKMGGRVKRRGPIGPSTYQNRPYENSPKQRKRKKTLAQSLKTSLIWWRHESTHPICLMKSKQEKCRPRAQRTHAWHWKAGSFPFVIRNRTPVPPLSYCSSAWYRSQPEGRAWWLKPVIPALWEAEAGGSRGQDIETILVNMVKPRLY